MDALQFSGGKDSLACLYLLRERWADPDFCVVWVNTGASYPEVETFVRSFTGVRMVEVPSNQPEFIEKHGFPSDVVPIAYTEVGHSIGLKSPFLVSDYLSCCAANLWRPMSEAMTRLGVTTVYRGQRNDETRRSPIVDGHVENGITYRFPIHDWTEERVFEYLREVGAPIPAYYKTEKSSRDCWSCTAYLDENRERIANLPSEQREVVMGRLAMIRSAVSEVLCPM